jgi:hypothetical protein
MVLYSEGIWVRFASFTPLDGFAKSELERAAPGQALHEGVMFAFTWSPGSAKKLFTSHSPRDPSCCCRAILTARCGPGKLPGLQESSSMQADKQPNIPGSTRSVTGAAVSSKTASSPASARSAIRNSDSSNKAVNPGSGRSASVFLSAAAALARLQLIYMSAHVECSCAEAPLCARYLLPFKSCWYARGAGMQQA